MIEDKTGSRRREQAYLVEKKVRGESSANDTRHYENIKAVRTRLSKQFGIPETELKSMLWSPV